MIINKALWSAEHRTFAVETFLIVVIIFLNTLKLLRTHFNVVQHGNVLYRKKIGNWVKNCLEIQRQHKIELVKAGRLYAHQPIVERV